MGLRLGPRDAAVEQPGIELLVALEAQARREQPPPGDADLVLDLTLLPACARGAGDRLHQVMPTHLQEPAIVGALLANEDRVHRGLHVVVDPARAGALEEGKRPVVAVEHHLLALSRIRPHERHPAVAEPQVRHLHDRRHALDHDDLVAPVELVGFAGCEAQRHEGRRRRRILPAPPSGRVAPHRIIAAGIAETAQLFEDAHQRQPFPAPPRRVRCQKPFQLLPPRPQLRLRLHPPLVSERGLARADHLPHDLPRDLQLSADRLDGLALHEVPATYLRDRLHDQHPEPGSRDHRSTLEPHADGVPIGRRSPRQGVLLPRRSTRQASPPRTPSWRASSASSATSA